MNQAGRAAETGPGTHRAGTGDGTSEPAGRVAVVFRDDAGRRPAATTARARLAPVLTALAGLGLAAEPVAYSDARAEQVRGQLLAVDGVLAWVDPVAPGGDRVILDDILRQAARAGVWIGSHPDVIARMGTKEVLYHTRELGWGSDVQLYRTPGEFRQRFPARLAADGIRVLKASRGNGGSGVWKVMLGGGLSGAPVPGPGDRVRVQHARIRDETSEDVLLGALMARCEAAFSAYAGTGTLIDQAFARRIDQGIIRCYLVQNRLAGFARQSPRGLAPGERQAASPDPDPQLRPPASWASRPARPCTVPASLPSSGSAASSSTTGYRACKPASASPPPRFRPCGTPTSCSAPRPSAGATPTSFARSTPVPSCPSRPKPRPSWRVPPGRP